MRINPKSQKGAITLIVLVTMLFLIAFLMSMYIRISNKAQTSSETTEEIAKKYNNIGEADNIYNSYFANSDVIPIYTVEQLKKIGSGEKIEINGKIYTFTTNGYYTLMNDLDLGGYDDENDTWLTEWEPLTDEFTGIMDGLGHTISGLYINNKFQEQGLFGNLNGTVKNVIIEDSFISGTNYVGAIAGKNNGTIENCYNKGTIIGNDYVGGIAGNLSENLINCSNIGNIIADTNVTGGYFKSIETDEVIEVWSNNVLEKNAYFVSGSYTATAPKGFKVSKNIFEQTIEDGMVIQDAEENEFVWVPVEITGTTQAEKEASFELIRTDGYANGSLQTLVSAGTISEPLANGGYAGENDDYNAMRTNIIKHGGFYIGRYEAGSETPRYNTSNGTTTMSVKRGKYPYNYVSWGSAKNNYTSTIGDDGYGAVYLSKNMYTDETKFGVTSTLCYGIQWDAIMKFVEDNTHSISNSTSWGNYVNRSFEITGKYCTTPHATTLPNWIAGNNLTKSVTCLLTTGASETNKAKNIYDLAGNVWEWTMEAYSSSSRVGRGGDFVEDGGDCPVSFRVAGYHPSANGVNISFRPALYIK